MTATLKPTRQSMKYHEPLIILLLSLIAAASTSAAVHYVDLNSANPTPPYTSWATAATNIQDAVDAAVGGDQILVTNGVYETGGKFAGGSNRVVLDKPIVLQSVNGPSVTIINGSGSMRCVFMANGTFLAGFTLTNGAPPPYLSAGGVGFGDVGSTAVVSNCVIVGCSAKYGGGAGPAGPFYGHVPLGGTLINCILQSNSASHADFNIPGVGG